MINRMSLAKQARRLSTSLLVATVGLTAPHVVASEVPAESIPVLIDGEMGEAYRPDYYERSLGDEGPLFLALFGDSVSLATMADAKFGNPGPRFFADFIRSASTAALYGATVGRINKTPGEDQQHMLMHQHFGNMARIELSPYLGRQAYSLPVLIKDATGFAPKIYNGAQMAGSYYFSHLYLEKFATFFKEHPFHKKPEIIFVNFNGMDFMADHGLEAFAADVRAFYQGLASLSPQSTLIVSEIGDPIPLLTHPDRVAVERSPGGPIKCSDLYKLVRLANSSGLSPNSTQEQIGVARAHLAEMRTVLRDEVDLMNTRGGPYREFEGKAIYLPASISDEEGVSHIAADCIHPDAYLQTLLGIKLWQVVEPLL